MEEQPLRFRTENHLTVQRANEFNAGYQEQLPLYHILRLFEIVMAVLIGILLLCLPEELGELCPKMLGLGAFLLALELLVKLRSRKGNQTYRRSLITNGGREMHNELLFYEDEFVDRNLDTGNAITYRYDTIRRIFETPNLYVLMLGEGLGLMADKASLSGGSQQEFAAFLLEKSAKMKKKKVRGTKFGRVLRTIMVGAVILLMLAALYNLPAMQFWRHCRVDPTASMSYRQVADTLESLGITGADQWLLDSLEEGYEAMTVTERAHFSKAQWLMAWLGDQAWDSGSHGVYWLYLLPDDPEMQYRDFFENLNILAPELKLTYLSEDKNLPDYPGMGVLTFSCRGEEYAWDVSYYGDWFDVVILERLRLLLEKDDDPRDLYVTGDAENGLLIFYRDPKWAEEFTKATGLKLNADRYA